MEPAYQTLGSPTPFMGGGSPVQTYSVDDTADSAPIAVDDGTTPYVNLPPAIVNSRADKAEYGLSKKTDKTKEDFVQAITSGEEPAIRKDVAVQVDKQRMEMARGMIAQGRVNSFEDLQRLTAPTDPDSVIESHYAQKYMDNLNWPKETDSKDSWAFNDKGALEPFKMRGTGFVGKIEYLKTLQENSEQEYNQQSFLQKADPIVGDIVTFGARSEIGLRGNVKGTDQFSGLGLGTNLDVQAERLFDMSDADFKAEANRIYLAMPVDLRSQWLSAMIGMSNSEVFLNNFMTAVNVAPLTGITKSAAEGLLKTAKTAVVSTIKGTAATGVPPVIAAPAAAGNASASALKKVVIDKIDEFKGNADPSVQLMDRLTDNYRVDVEAASANPGRLGREQANRIKDIYDSSEASFTDTMLHADRVNTTPAVILESNVKKIQENLADMHRGPDNTVLQVSKPIYVPGLNVYAHNVAIGTMDADFHKSYSEAFAAAKRDGHIVRGEIINTPENMKKYQELSHLIRVEEEQLIDSSILRQKLAEIPRHEEGVTIETQAIKKQGFPNVPEDHVRFFHGGDNPTSGGGRWVSEDMKYARDYRKNVDLHYVDIPESWLSKNVNKIFDDTGTGQRSPYVNFETPERFAKQMRPVNLSSEGTIEQQGAGFYINKVVYLPIDQSFVTDGLITTKIGDYSVAQFRADARSMVVSTGILPSWGSGWVNAVLGRGRTPAERLSLAENANRLISTHGPSVLLGMAEGGTKPIVKIPASEWKGFDRLVRAGMKAHNENTKIPGIWYNDPAEIEKWYLQNLGHLPSQHIIDAYFAFKSHMLTDLNVRTINVLKNKLRIGTEQHTVSFMGPDDKLVTLPFFEGVKLQKLPADKFRILVVGENKKNTKDYTSGLIPLKGSRSRESLQDAIDTGRAKVIHILDPKSKPLSELTSKRIEYVVTFNHQSKPISFNPLNRMGGGHFIPEFDWYHKQANVEIDGANAHYNGDKTIMSFATKAQADEALPHMEKVRQLFKKHADKHLTAEDEADIARFEGEGGATAGSRDYIDQASEANKITGIPFNKHYDWYFGKNAHLNVNEPIQVAGKNSLIGQVDKTLEKRYTSQGKEWIDGTKDGSLLSKMMVEFTGERDAEELYTIANRGTKQDPLFAYEPSEYLDPITAMNRAFSRMVKSTYMDDMKAFSASHWLKQAEEYLKPSVEELMASPTWHMWNPVYKDNVPKKILWQLESNRKQAIDFLGRASDADAFTYQMLNAAADIIYNKTSSTVYADNALGRAAKAVDKKIALIPLWLIPKSKDPVGVLRSFAYLGNFLFNPASFFTQAATFANIFAISPIHATHAGMATSLYAVTRLNRSKEVLAHLDKLATGFYVPGVSSRFKPGQFLEAFQALENSGFDHYGNTHAFQNNVPTTKVVSSGLHNIIQWAQAPIAIGAASTRVAGYFTAYLEWRALNPTAILDRQAKAGILNRAALLDHNMSSAMSTSLHTGAMSIPMQFQAYSLRLAEMMTGKQLTPMEKTRLFGVSTVLWGARGTLGLAAFPAANYLISQLESAGGYVTGKDTSADWIINGTLSLIGAFISGGGDPHKGTWYNFSKWGNQGVDPLEKMFESDHSLVSLFAGPPGSMFESLINDAYPVLKLLNDPLYKPAPADYLSFMKEMAVVRSGWQSWMAAKYGQWLTKNETLVSSEVTTMQAAMSFLAGIKPVEYTDVFYAQKTIRDEEAKIKWWTRYVGTQIARSARATIDKDDGNAKQYMNNATAAMDMFIPANKRSAAIAEAYRNYGQDLISRANWKLLIDIKHDYDTFQKIQQVKEGKK